MSNVPILEAVRAAFAFRRRTWRLVAPILGVVAVGAGMDFAGELSGDSALRIVGSLVNLAATLVAYAALLRIAFMDEAPERPDMRIGPGGVQMGRPELHLLGVYGLMFLVGLIATSAFILIGIIVVMVMLSAGIIPRLEPNATPQQFAAAMTPQAWALLSLLLSSFVVAMIYLFTRLSLAMAATISRGRVAVFQTWALTKGQAGRIFAAIVLSNAPSIAVFMLLAAAVSLTSGSAEAGRAPQVDLPIAAALGVVWGLVTAFIQLPINIGLTAFLYRGLRPAGER